MAWEGPRRAPGQVWASLVSRGPKHLRLITYLRPLLASRGSGWPIWGPRTPGRGLGGPWTGLGQAQPVLANTGQVKRAYTGI